MAELVPAPFPQLLRRMLREWERETKVFDLPARRFWRGSHDLDTSVVVHGRRVANPVELVPRPLAGRREVEHRLRVHDPRTAFRPARRLTLDDPDARTVAAHDTVARAIAGAAGPPGQCAGEHGAGNARRRHSHPMHARFSRFRTQECARARESSA